ncbi:unnamed protein product [Paramecium sonneborni]|uniref:poly(ADP-ribose) glycohydrolase n=1 Tax=Paramecium sonneborni TaxID=65129 RepID=A0A8S1RIS7_9CILI|nr:unnamed protein product [Paramecium sonneborni]
MLQQKMFQDNDFECYLVDNNYDERINKEVIFQKIDKETDGKFLLYLKENIFQNNQKLDDLLKRIKESWNKDKMVELTRKEIFTLIISMFLQLINRKKQYGGFYIINMEYIKNSSFLCQQKMQCIINYIKQFYKNKKNIEFINDIVKFIKNTQNDAFSYKVDDISKKNINIEITNRRNEDQMNSTVVDFADENIGGLTLDSYNCAQEEILMLIYPEALVSMIFIPPMKADEAVLIKNIKKFSNYSGYEQSFKWKQQQQDWINYNFNMLAIDAKPFHGNQIKCYLGFLIALQEAPDQNISTGRWGCGIFGGNQYLKTIIQLTCFAQAKYQTNINNNNTGTAKLIINASNNTELFNFVNKLKSYGEVLNLENLDKLIKQLQFQNDDQFQNYIINYFQQLPESQKPLKQIRKQ